LGEVLLTQEMALMADYGQRLGALMAEGETLPVLADTLELAVGGDTWRLSGALSDVRSTGRVRGRYDDARATDYLDGWIDHLFLNAQADGGAARRTVWVSRDGGFELSPLDRAEARAQLASLVGLFGQGLTGPLRFFPKSAWTYVEEWAGRPDTALEKARKVWAPNRNGYGESTGAAYGLALRGVVDPLDQAFEANAQAVFGPLREHLTGEGARHV
jgi:exodeoxyribonuclease V gamma subunit